ncbi:MAG: YciI family protein [Acidobacteriota bacterium]
MSDDERRIMQEHVDYWKARLDRGDVVVFGPVLDPAGSFGMGVISAADETGARAFAENDPAVKSNCGFKCEIHVMRAITRETVN